MYACCPKVEEISDRVLIHCVVVSPQKVLGKLLKAVKNFFLVRKMKENEKNDLRCAQSFKDNLCM